jgi:PQQ-dependent dehydrogenase (s-GDH family)
MKTRLLIAAIFLFCSLVSSAQAPANDLCANAIQVTVGPGCSTVSGTLYNATLVSITGGCSNNKDVWYKFQVPTGSHSVSIKTTITSATPSLTTANTSVELFNASACPPASTSLTCATILNPKLYSGLVPGNTYMFRITTSVATTGAADAYDFNVCVTSNDEPATALMLIQGPIVDGNLLGAGTTPGIPVGSCTGTPDDDLYYKFIATSSVATINVTSVGGNLNTSGVRTQLFSGPAGSLTSIACGTTRLDATGLTPGDTYYCRIYSAGPGQTGTGWAYKISYVIPVNDDPLNALVLVRGGALVDGNLMAGSATTGIPVNCATGDPDDDIYFKFIATTSYATLQVSSGGADLNTSGVRTQIFSGAVGSFNSIACGTTAVQATGLTPGDAYYCRVYSAGTGQTGTAWSFKIGYLVNANDDPLNATTITSGATITSNLLAAEPSPGIPVACATGNPDDDVYFKFVAATPFATFQVNTIGADLNTSGVRTQIFSGPVGSFNSIACGTTVVQGTGLIPGDTYYCRVYSAGTGQTGPAWNFKINYVLTANDDALNATLITAGGSIGSTLLGAEASPGIPVACATGNPDDDVYFKFVATTSYATFQVTSPGADLNTSGIRTQIFSGPLGSFTSIACGNTRIEATGLTVGDTYYCRIYSAGTGQTGPAWNFTFKWLVNTIDDPLAAATIIQGVPYNGTLLAAGVTSGIPAGCASDNPDDDVYIKFVPAATYASFSVTNMGADLTASGVRTQIFAGPIGSFTSVSCGNNRIVATGLIPGDTYYCRVYSAGTGQTGTTWTFRLTWLLSPGNDDPANAVDLIAGSTVSGDLLAASGTAGIPSGCATSTPGDDVYFKFTPVYSYATLTVSGAAADLAASGVKTQVFSGPVGSFTSVACGGSTVNLTGLTPGNTYYCRVSSAGIIQTGLIYTFKLSLHPSALTIVTGGRMQEVYSQQILSAPNILADPWEVTYGPDANLWVTESKGYKVYKINPVTGFRDTILDISQFSTTSPDNTFNCQFNNGSGAQGGLAGLALHPKFLAPVGAKNYVYLAYVYSQTSANVFVNRVVRFTYNTSINKLEAPVSVCDTLPGSNDHNSQRMIIAPVGGIDYLFYAQGDMGAGQFGNALRAQNAQNIFSYEGKILRFNLEPDGDADAREQWIPSTGAGNATNPYNVIVGKQHAVWAMGMRNNQGFVYDPILDRLYGSSHGPFSDDEINVIERGKNYGHPIVIGYADGNANGTTAGASPGMSPAYPSSCPDIVDEVATAAALPNYKDPLFSAYPSSVRFPTLKGLWDEMPVSNNGIWPSEGLSGLDFYTNTIIPGWKRSLVASSLKWGRLLRLKLDVTGTKTAPTNTAADTISYFGSQNRFRDLAFAPNGKDIYVIMDRSTSTSGPSAMFPVVPACQGCLQKYSFIGYNDYAGQSSIPTSIDVTDGTLNSCNSGTTISIDNSNNTYWVPITGPDGNIMAEIYANGQNLGTITSSFYQNSGPLRIKNGASYADRNITITPQNQPSGTVKVRLYLTRGEYDAFDADPLSGISTLSDIRVHKNNDPCQNAIAGATTIFTPTFATAHGANGYAVQIDISSFSTFYIGSTTMLLPLSSLNFTGKYSNAASNLKWETKNEVGTNHFEVERSTGDGVYAKISSVEATGITTETTKYAYNDQEAARLGASRLYYRLKVIDNDGGYTYSNVVVIDIPGSFITRISIFPNPADKQATVLISSPEEQKVTWQLVDVTGRSVVTKDVVLKKGENRIVLDLNKLRTGTYFLQVKGQYVNAQEKIQKL